LTWCADGRTSANFVGLLNRVAAHWPEGEIILILDNLSTHKTLDVLLWALTHPRVRFLFQPSYAPWLNLIEPWWKTLRSLALKGRRFLTAAEIIHAIGRATDYWNRHRHP
jgi:transposase